MGLLTIRNAMLDPKQIWPKGNSDGDTLVIDVTGAIFEFQPHATAAPSATSLYHSARVYGQYGWQRCVRGSTKRTITVRLQGIDAPELHYTPQLPTREGGYQFTDAEQTTFDLQTLKFRQAFAEKAAQEFRKLLPSSDNPFPVQVVSFVDLPNELFDLYGRFIGDVMIADGVGGWSSLNLMMVKGGWAFPSYYDSMDSTEITQLNQAWNTHGQSGAMWQAGFQYEIPPIDPRMVLRPNVAGPDLVQVLTNPKVFRVQTQWWVRSKAQLYTQGLLDFLKTKPANVFLTADFLNFGRSARKQTLWNFVAPNETITFEPQDVVYTEEVTDLRQPNGDAITCWSGVKAPIWSKQLSPTTWVNSVAICDDGSRMIGGTFLHDYGLNQMVPDTFGAYCYDSAGQLLWSDPYAGWDGVFSVAISADGSTAAAGGNTTKAKGRLRVYNAATGAVTLDCTSIPTRISSVSLSSDGRILAAGVANRNGSSPPVDNLHVFQRNQGGGYSVLGTRKVAGGGASVAVHPSGDWLVACGMGGEVVLVTVANGAINGTYRWQASPKAIDRADSNSPLAPVPFLCVAIAGQTESFVVGGGDFVYRFTKSGMVSGQAPVQPLEYDTWDGDAPIGRVVNQAGKAAENVRWLALSADGAMLRVVANRKIGYDLTGVLITYKNRSRSPVWKLRLPRNPNGISTDPAGKFIAVADGFPIGAPGSIFLFDSDGHELWHHPTTNMNWPVAISADGSTLAAGGDDGNLYRFAI